MAPAEGGLGTQASVGLRAGGGAAILVFGTLGVGLPFLLRRLRDGAPWLLYTKAAAAGVVLALALVHLINDAFSTFAELEPGAPPLAAAATPHVSPHGPSGHAAQPVASRGRPCCGRDCTLGVPDGSPGANARRGCLGAARSGLQRCASGQRCRHLTRAALAAAAVAGVLMRRAPAAQGRCTTISP